METAHLASLGAHPISRCDFAATLVTLVDGGDEPGQWPVDGMRDIFRKTGAAAGPPQGSATINTERSEQPSPLSHGKGVGG